MDEKFQQRLHQLELIESDYLNMRRMLDDAKANRSLERFAGEIILQANAATGKLISANDLASELLGYSHDELLSLKISDLETLSQESETTPQQYRETDIIIHVYECYFRQRDGRLCPMRVQRRRFSRDGVEILHYALEDRSLRHHLWQELNRREDADFQFREKLKILNEINAELGVSETLDEICLRAIRLGIERLGFERLSIWMFDPQTHWMHGTFGVDESGNIRDERSIKWPIGASPIMDFARGLKSPIITQDNAPIYNNMSEIIGYGWHISAPLLYEGGFIGYMTADNYFSHQPMKSFQPELLQTYAATIGHFYAHQRDRESAVKLTNSVKEKQNRIQMLGTFIMQISHDFRTPLTIINTNTYLLRKSQDEARRTEITHKIENQVAYIDRVIKQMLEVVKLEERVDFTLLSLKLGVVLENASQTIAAIAAEKQIKFTLESTPLVQVLADGEWLERAIREILLNAVQYTNEGGRITVSTYLEGKDVIIRISDTGIGIAPHEIEKIFNHLYRVDQARTSQGVGLGLTLAKLVVEAHGGCIRVESTLGVGSTFEVVVPNTKKLMQELAAITYG